MTRAVLLFVHGTGVRGVGYSATLEVIRKQVAERELPVDVQGCFWGGSPGATLGMDGSSVPGYSASGGGRALSPADQDVALWSVLYTDPWYELRLLHAYKDAQASFGSVPASQVLRDHVAALPGTGDLRERLAVEDLTEGFAAARTSLLGSAEFADAAATARGLAPLHRQALSRALVAWTLVDALDTGRPMVSGVVRDSLVDATVDELDAHVMGVSDFLTRPLKGIATWYATRRRGRLTDGVANPGGDIMRYLARGEAAREFVGRAIADCGDRPVVVLAHSLGGIMSADVLVRAPLPQVTRLVTVGSQTPFLYEIGAFPGLEPPAPLPDHFPPWLNIYDRRDLLSYVGQTLFGDRVEDVGVDNGQPFPESHSAYWTNPETWAAIGRAVP